MTIPERSPDQLSVLSDPRIPASKWDASPRRAPYLAYVCFFLTACDRCFSIPPITVRLQEDALARLERFLTVLYLFEIAGQFRAGHT